MNAIAGHLIVFKSPPEYTVADKDILVEVTDVISNGRFVEIAFDLDRRTRVYLQFRPEDIERAVSEHNEDRNGVSA